MGERTEYTPGLFCWADLATTDQEAAKTFYSGLFGWEAEDMPMDDQGGVYSMMKIRGRNAAAIAPQPPQQRDAGMPPMWNNYVSVSSADETASRAGELGATVHLPPFDVLDVGRMTVLGDPQGAFLMAWEPRRHIGAEIVNEPGALCWNELASPDFDGSKSFYGDLFGWSFEPFENSPQPYEIIQVGDRGNGGIRQPQDGEAPNWSPFFAVDDVEASLSKAEELGGTRLMGPMDIQVAQIGAASDPQGAVLQLYAGELQD